MIVFLFFYWATFATSVSQNVRADDLAKTELRARSKDLDAVNYYKEALKQLGRLNSANKKKTDEPALAMRILETLNRMIAIQFRLVHGLHKSPAENDAFLKEYQITLNYMMNISSNFMKNYPQHRDVGRAIYLRAKVNQELEKTNEAILDYRYLIDHFPQNADIISAEINLYELFMKTKDYRTAIDYLNKFNAKPTDKYYPIFLEKLAFAHFYLNEIPQAIQLIEQDILYYSKNSSDTTNQADIDKLFLNAVLFFYTGLERKLPNYNLAGALPFIKSLQPGQSLGKLLEYFAKILRTKGLLDELENFKHSVFSDRLDKFQTTGITLIALDTEVIRSSYSLMQETTQFLSQAINLDKPDPRIQKGLSDAAAALQIRLEKQKNKPEASLIAPNLIALDNLLLRITDGTPLSTKIRFNLAETLFLIKKYPEAVLQYRWIVEHGSSSAGELREDARLKAIIVMYENISVKNLFPKEIRAQVIPANSPPLAVEIRQWITWLDQPARKKDQAVVDTYIWEANRLLYSQGQITEVIDRMLKSIRRQPTSKNTVPAASLILDSYVVSEKWKETYDIATEFLKLASAAGFTVEFKARIQLIANDSYFKITETAYRDQNYPLALKRIDGFLSQPGQAPDSEHNVRFLTLGASTALAQKNKKLALTYFSKIPQKYLDSGTLKLFLLTSGSLAEDHYEFENSAIHYRKYIAIEPTSAKELKIKTILFSWFSGKPTFLGETLRSPKLCTGPMTSYCEYFHVILGFLAPDHKDNKAILKEAYGNAHQGSAEIRSAWAALALENPKSLTYLQKLELLRTVAQGWNQVEPFTKLTLIPFLSVSIVEALKLTANTIRSQSPISLRKEAIQKRVALIEKMEATLQPLANLPWSRIRAQAVDQWSRLYSTLSADIAALPLPSGLSQEERDAYNQTLQTLREPLMKKHQALKKQAIDIASQAGIESGIYQEITSEDPETTPEGSSSLHPQNSVEKSFEMPKNLPSLFNLGVFSKLQGSPEWLQSISQAVAENHLGKMEFLIQDAIGKKYLQDGEAALARGGLLCSAGAQAEGLLQLEDGMQKIKRDLLPFALTPLIRGYYATRNTEKVKKAVAMTPSHKDLDTRFSLELFGAVEEAAIPEKNSLKNDLGDWVEKEMRK